MCHRMITQTTTRAARINKTNRLSKLAIALSACLVALAFVSRAQARGVDDGNAGLAAMESGDYDSAISLFTRALKRGGLAGDDREFAYANRGRAYLKKGDFSSAIVDLDRARQMKPDDADAQNDLVAALAAKLPAASIPGLPKPGFLDVLGQALLRGVKDGIQQGVQNGNSDPQGN